MKVFVAIGFLILTSLAHAENAANNCTKVLFNLIDWTELSAQAMTCLNSNENFNNGISALCDSSRSQLSIEYTQFLKYKKEYEDTLAWYQGLPYKEQQTASARYKLQLAKENWETLGLKSTIRAIKSRLDESFRFCNPVKF